MKLVKSIGLGLLSLALLSECSTKHTEPFDKVTWNGDSLLFDTTRTLLGYEVSRKEGEKHMMRLGKNAAVEVAFLFEPKNKWWFDVGKVHEKNKVVGNGGFVYAVGETFDTMYYDHTHPSLHQVSNTKKNIPDEDIFSAVKTQTILLSKNPRSVLISSHYSNNHMMQYYFTDRSRLDAAVHHYKKDDYGKAKQEMQHITQEISYFLDDCCRDIAGKGKWKQVEGLPYKVHVSDFDATGGKSSAYFAVKTVDLSDAL